MVLPERGAAVSREPMGEVIDQAIRLVHTPAG